MATSNLKALEAYRQACRTEPTLVRDSTLRKGVALYSWYTSTQKKIRIPAARELVLIAHLAGSSNVKVIAGNGTYESFSNLGDIILVPQGESICLCTDKPLEFATILFPPDAPPPREPSSWLRLLRLSSCLIIQQDAYVYATVEAVIQAIKAPPNDDFRYFSQIFDALISHLARIVDKSATRQHHITTQVKKNIKIIDFDAVLTHVETHLTEKLTLKDLTKQAGVSRSLFAREFTGKFGISPHQYIVQRRIAKAMNLLLQSELSVTDVAYETGFCNQSHFSTTFKSLTGLAPSNYAANG